MIQRIITMHCTNHVERGEADAVWGEALCRNADADMSRLIPNTDWRIISFDGRRGKQINVRPKEYASLSFAELEFYKKFRAKAIEGYFAVEWTNPYYGLMRTIRDIDADFFDMTISESTRVGMDLNSPLWRAICGTTGLMIPTQELIDNFNASQGRGGDIEQAQVAVSGRFAPDPSIGAHVFLWNGLERDANFERCGVCSKKLSKHQRLVVNYRGRLARHIWRPSQTGYWQCRHCNLERGGAQGRVVHSTLDTNVEYISGTEAMQFRRNINTPVTTFTGGEVAVEVSERVYRADPEIATPLVPDEEALIIGDIIERTEQIIESTILGDVVSDKKATKLESLPAKPKPHSGERTGGLLDFDI